MATINWSIEQVRDTAAQLKATNPLLSSGQLGFESDTQKGKVGPGYYNDLTHEPQIDVVKANEAWETDQRDGGDDTPSDIEISDVNGLQAALDDKVDEPVTIPDPTDFLSVSAGNGSGIYRKGAAGQFAARNVWEDPNDSDNVFAPMSNGGPSVWLEWRFLVGGVLMYTSTEDVADPSLVTTWTLSSGVDPLPSIRKYEGTLQEVLEAIANKREYPRTIQYSGTALTLTAAHFGLIIECTSASVVTITVPSGLTLTAGQSVWIVQGGDGRVDLAASSTTLNSATNSLSTYGQHSTVSVTRAVASNTFRVAGELA